MTKELENRLVARWPRWFDTKGDVRRTLMSFGFDHGDGWFEILWRLCEELEPLVTNFERVTGCRFEVLQVKEKFGGLRFYVSDKDQAIGQALQEAQRESFSVCEVCGDKGRLRDGTWIKTLCDDHAALSFRQRKAGSTLES